MRYDGAKYLPVKSWSLSRELSSPVICNARLLKMAQIKNTGIVTAFLCILQNSLVLKMLTKQIETTYTGYGKGPVTLKLSIPKDSNDLEDFWEKRAQIWIFIEIIQDYTFLDNCMQLSFY